MMDVQYFLEMVDVKHRHGSNLRAYHTVWKNSPSSENFFHWLDHGEGKDVDLPQRPRDRLEKQQVRYLSPEERFNYLVKVDDAGFFRWAKNDELVETDDKRFKDSPHGVVRVEDVPRFDGSSHFENTASDSGSVSSPSSPSPRCDSDQGNEETIQFAQDDHEPEAAVRKSHIKAAAIYDHVASSVKHDMWIFVSIQIPSKMYTHLMLVQFRSQIRHFASTLV